MKTIYIDLETTGLDPIKNGIIQIAAIIECDGKSEEHFFDVAPFESDIISDDALETNGKTRDQIFAYEKPMDVYLRLINILDRRVSRYDRNDKFIFIGYNSRFDMDFLRAWFDKCNNKFFGSYFFFPPVDVMNLAAHVLRSDRHKMPNFKLNTVASYLSIELPEGEALHNAMTDIKMTMKIEQTLTEKLKA